MIRLVIQLTDFVRLIIDSFIRVLISYIFTASDTSVCVDVVMVGGNTYTSLYNTVGGVNTSQFSCVVSICQFTHSSKCDDLFYAY